MVGRNAPGQDGREVTPWRPFHETGAGIVPCTDTTIRHGSGRPGHDGWLSRYKERDGQGDGLAGRPGNVGQMTLARALAGRRVERRIGHVSAQLVLAPSGAGGLLDLAAASGLAGAWGDSGAVAWNLAVDPALHPPAAQRRPGVDAWRRRACDRGGRALPPGSDIRRSVERGPRGRPAAGRSGRGGGSPGYAAHGAPPERAGVQAEGGSMIGLLSCAPTWKRAWHASLFLPKEALIIHRSCGWEPSQIDYLDAYLGGRDGSISIPGLPRLSPIKPKRGNSQRWPRRERWT